MSTRRVVLAVAMLSSCATVDMTPVTTPGGAPVTMALRVVGAEADSVKRERCHEIAGRLGVTIKENASTVATLHLADSKNRLVVTVGGPNQVALDEPRPGWTIAALCADAIRKAAGRMPRSGILQGVVNEQLLLDPSFRALVDGASQAQTAFNMAADAPIDEIVEGTERYAELQNAISAAQNAYRQYLSYGTATLATALAAITPGYSEPAVVPLQGTGVKLRASATDGRLVLLAIESDRGRPIVVFDATARAIVTADFRPFLVGDQVDVSGAVKRPVRRGTTPAATPASGSMTGGCTKDTDCKVDRICVEGRCTSPGK